MGWRGGGGEGERERGEREGIGSTNCCHAGGGRGGGRIRHITYVGIAVGLQGCDTAVSVASVDTGLKEGGAGQGGGALGSDQCVHGRIYMCECRFLRVCVYTCAGMHACVHTKCLPYYFRRLQTPSHHPGTS